MPLTVSIDSKARMRASDADRDRVAERLRSACAEGRLTADELDERLDACLRAKTLGELRPLVADLPPAPPPVLEPRRASRSLARRPINPVALVLVLLAGYWMVEAGEWALAGIAVVGGAVLFAVVVSVAPIIALVAGTAWLVRRVFGSPLHPLR